MANACFRLAGTLAQTSPGYSSGGNYTLNSGFWTDVSHRGADEIFFTGFEEC
jgi:hypothetical protein